MKWVDIRPAAFWDTFGALAGLWLGVLIVYLLALLFAGWISFRRMPAPNRQLTYEATFESLETRDATDLALTIPWSLVYGVRSNNKLLIFQVRPRGRRFVPWRAFAAKDRDLLLSFANRSILRSPAGL
jgi:hypothetical protein